MQSKETLIHLSVNGNSNLPERCQRCPKTFKCPDQIHYGNNPPGSARTCIKRLGQDNIGVNVQRFHEQTSPNRNVHHEETDGAGTPDDWPYGQLVRVPVFGDNGRQVGLQVWLNGMLVCTQSAQEKPHDFSLQNAPKVSGLPVETNIYVGNIEVGYVNSFGEHELYDELE